MKVRFLTQAQSELDDAVLGTINDLKASAKSFSTNSTALFGWLRYKIGVDKLL